MSVEDQQRNEAVGEALMADLAAAFVDAGKVACQGYPADDGDLVVAEGIRNVTRIASSAFLLMLEADPAYPYLSKLLSVTRQYGLPGIDCVYHYAPLHGDYEYELRGQRGSACVFEVEVWRGHLSRMREWVFFSTHSRNFEPGEELHIRFSREPKEGDWISLPEGDCCVLIRQYYADWDTEQPASLALTRVGAVFPPPRLTLDEVAKRIGQVTHWTREVVQAGRQYVQQDLDCDPATLRITRLPFGFSKLFYVRGHYRCTADQAVILEVKPPQAQYWNFQLGNLNWEGLHYHMAQTSLNHHQAALDSDGVFRAVISHVDPGVANWLDAGGRTLGMIWGRYYNPDSEPAPSLRTVPLADLNQWLPADTHRVTQSERQQIIMARMLSTIRRQCAD